MKYRYLVIGPNHNGGTKVFFAKDWSAVNDILVGNEECNPWWDGKHRFLMEKDVSDGEHSTTGLAPLHFDDDGVAGVMVLKIEAIAAPKPTKFVTRFEEE
jgi:hypothetical protein